MELLEIEDWLQIDCEVFENGMTGRSAHMDSYMTVIDFNKLDKAMNSCPFSKEDMLAAADNWRTSELSPIHRLLAWSVERHYKQKESK